MNRQVPQTSSLNAALRIPIAAAVFVLLSLPVSLDAGQLQLKPETLRAWDQYVQGAGARMQARLGPGCKFLWIDEQPGRKQRVHAGEILVAPIDEHVPKAVPSGLIHDWIAATFLPNTTLSEVLAVVRDYDHYAAFYKPYVMEAKPLSQAGEEDRFSMTLLNKSFFQHNALENDYETTYFRLSPSRIYSVSHTTRVQEIDNLGRPSQHAMPVDTGSGYIWRLYTISRMEEGDGGVYVELEAMALSRDVPGAYRWFVDPIVRRVSKDAMITTLKQTSDAVHSSVEAANRSGCATNADRNCAQGRKSPTDSALSVRSPN